MVWIKDNISDSTGGAETTISKTNVIDADLECYSNCKAASDKNAFYGLRSDVTGFKCRCFEPKLEGVIAQVRWKTFIKVRKNISLLVWQQSICSGKCSMSSHHWSNKEPFPIWHKLDELPICEYCKFMEKDQWSG